jgi:hypothetical protein
LEVLDKRQVELIESVHRGFLYQHLYAVGCLLLASKSDVISVVVEHDEDIEVVSNVRTYIQVKTRSTPIIPSDINGVLERFNDLRDEHVKNQRSGDARFIIVANSPPSPKFAKQLASKEWPLDVKFQWPKAKLSNSHPAFPPAWDNINEAFNWCVSQAEKLPFLLISPDSLVWKLAGRVMLACTGSALNPNHSFHTDDLPELFEQLLQQLQDFPSPPNPYRPQLNEPPLEMDNPVRIICGFSGSGKTAWASQAAKHACETIAYYDVGELPGSALATSLVRELAPRLVERGSEVVRSILYPGATGLESLSTLGAYLKEQDRQPIIVLDNAHRIPAKNLRAVIDAAVNIRFILLCQPSDELRIIEAHLGLNREILSGWDLDTVALVAQSNGCKGSIAAFNKLIKLTAGVPLYVQSSAVLCASRTAGDLDEFCSELEALTHTEETVQEIILNKLYESFPDTTKNILAVWSLSDVAFQQDEVIKLLEAALNLKQPIITETLRGLRKSGVIEVFGRDSLKVHDAIRIIGRRHLVLMGDDAALKSQRSLKDILMISLTENRDTSKFSLFTRTLVALNEIETLVELAGNELFHEMGISNEIIGYLLTIANSLDTDPKQRFWALDGLVFDAIHNGRIDTVGDFLDGMEDLVGNHEFGIDEKMSYIMKRMLYEGNNGSDEKVLSLINVGLEEIPDKPMYMRIFKYNAVASLLELGRVNASLPMLDELIEEYFELIGIAYDDMFGNRASVLLKRMNDYPELYDDLKRLSTSLILRANHSSTKKSISIRLQCMKLYEIAGAYDSFITTAQDLTDDFVELEDYVGAKEVMDDHIMPNISKLGLMNRLFDVRCQYAVILAYCGKFSESEKELERIVPLITGQPERMQEQLMKQRRLIEKIRTAGLNRGMLNSLIKKVGRNELCPCGSNIKYKKCHGI